MVKKNATVCVCVCMCVYESLDKHNEKMKMNNINQYQSIFIVF